METLYKIVKLRTEAEYRYESAEEMSEHIAKMEGDGYDVVDSGSDWAKFRKDEIK